MRKIIFASCAVPMLLPSLALSGPYYCKSEAKEYTEQCPTTLGCPGTCKVYTWSRGYCGTANFRAFHYE